jgi:hypothetical protein
VGLNGATLQGHRVTQARATIPAWGCWYADASIDGEHTLTGSVTLKIADLTLVGTVLSGSAAQGRSSYRIVGGKGGWGFTIPRKSYANDAGVKHSTILTDAANECGETLGTVSTTERVGPAFVRQEGPASRVLQAIAPQAWYVNEAGVTQLGARAAGALVGKVTRIEPVDRARGKVVLATEQIATILPGVVVDGLTATDVQHDISAKSGIRSTVWFAQSPGPLDSFRAIIDQIDPDRAYRGVTEYRVVTLSGNRLNLQPIRVGAGMPDLERVPVRPGVAGCHAELTLGARVLVAFIDSDPARPCVVGAEEDDGDGFLPTMLELAGGSDFVALAASVATQLQSIRTQYNLHTHATAGTGAPSPPVVAMTSPGSVAATKVKAT